MTNGRISRAEIEAMLSGDRRKVDLYLLTAISEIRERVNAIPEDITSAVKACRAERERETSAAEDAARVEAIRRQLRSERRFIIAWTVGILAPVLGLILTVVNLIT